MADRRINFKLVACPCVAHGGGGHCTCLCSNHEPHRRKVRARAKHRNDRPIDACSLVVLERWRSENPRHGENGGACADYPPRHAAARVAEDEGGAG